MDAHAVLLDGLGVLARAVALVAVPGIAPIAPRQASPSAGRASPWRRSTRRPPIATGRRRRPRRAPCRGSGAGNDVAVDQRGADRHAEPAIGGAHAPQARLQDVDAVDAFDRSDHDRHERGGDDLGVTVLARLRRQDFRIVQALRDTVGIEDHGSDHDRPGPWPAAGLVDAGDWVRDIGPSAPLRDRSWAMGFGSIARAANPMAGIFAQTGRPLQLARSSRPRPCGKSRSKAPSRTPCD